MIPAGRADLALEFANTRFWRGREVVTETLNVPDDLIGFLAGSAGIAAEALEPVAARWRSHPAEGTRALDEAIRLREAIYRIFRATAESTGAKSEDLALLNATLAAAPARHVLAKTGDGFAWTLPALNADVTTLLAPVLWAAGDLLVEPARVKVRRCANDECVWLFLDDSKSATRRWCAMSSCGNRAKAHRHYEKTKMEAKKA